MGFVYSRLLRPFRTFNIENRTERIISKAKPVPAPQYPSTEKQREIVNELYPDFMETQKKKNIQLDKNLKSVYVVSTDPETKSEAATSTRPLPQERGHIPMFEYGFMESNVIPEGKCSLRDAVTFIVKHTENSVEYSVERIALEYKLDKEVVTHILEHFRVPKVMEKNKVNIIPDSEPK